MTGRRLAAEALTPQYWINQVRYPVQWLGGVRQLAELGVRTFIELSANPSLLPMLDGCRLETDGAWLGVPSLQRGRDDWQTVLGSVAQLWAAGGTVDGAAIGGEFAKRVVDLPSYAFERKRYWWQEPVDEFMQLIEVEDEPPQATAPEPPQAAPEPHAPAAVSERTAAE